MLSGRKSALSPSGAAVSAAVSGRSLTGLETYQIEASFPPAIAKSDGFQAVVPCLSQPRTVALRYRNFDKYCSHRLVAGRGRTFHSSKTAHRAVATAALFNLL